MIPALGEHWALAAIILIPACGALFALVMPGADRLALRYVGLGTSVGTACLALVKLRGAFAEPLTLDVIGLPLSLDAISAPLLLSLLVATPVALRSGAPRIFERTQFYVVTVLFAEALLAAALVIDAVFVRLALATLSAVPFFALVALFGGPLRGTTTMRAAMIWLFVDTGALAVLAWLAARGAVAPTDASTDSLRLACDALAPSLRPWVFVALAAPGLVRLAAGPFSLWFWSFFDEAPVSAAILSCAGVAPLGALLVVEIAVPVGVSGVVPAMPGVVVLAAVFVLLAGVIAMAERDVRRLLAQLVQAAGAATGVALVLLDHNAAAVGVVHCVAVGASASLTLAAIEAVERRAETRDAVELAGLGQVNPLLALLLLLGMGALVGIPAIGAGTTLWLLAGALVRADILVVAGLPPLAAVWLAVACAIGSLLASAGVAGAARRMLQPAPRRKSSHVMEQLTFGQGLRLVVPTAFALGVGLGAETLVGAAASAARLPLAQAREAAGLSDTLRTLDASRHRGASGTARGERGLEPESDSDPAATDPGVAAPGSGASP